MTGARGGVFCSCLQGLTGVFEDMANDEKQCPIDRLLETKYETREAVEVLNEEEAKQELEDFFNPKIKREGKNVDAANVLYEERGMNLCCEQLEPKTEEYFYEAEVEAFAKWSKEFLGRRGFRHGEPDDESSMRWYLCDQAAKLSGLIRRMGEHLFEVRPDFRRVLEMSDFVPGRHYFEADFMEEPRELVFEEFVYKEGEWQGAFVPVGSEDRAILFSRGQWSMMRKMGDRDGMEARRAEIDFIIQNVSPLAVGGHREWNVRESGWRAVYLEMMESLVEDLHSVYRAMSMMRRLSQKTIDG